MTYPAAFPAPRGQRGRTAGRARGFTLLELMMVITVAAVVLSVAVPSFIGITRNARMTRAANDLIAGLQYARSEAIKQRQTVTLCPTSDPNDATPSCDDTDVLTGWIVFVDSNGNGDWDDSSFVDSNGNGVQDVQEDDGGDGTFDVPADDTNGDGVLTDEEPTVPAEQVVRRTAQIEPGITAQASVDPFAVAYRDTGYTTTAAVNIVMCDSRGNVSSFGELSAARGISVSATGRVATTRGIDEITTMGGCP